VSGLRSLGWVSLVWLLAACPKATPAAAIDWEAMPQLPAPTAGTYSRAPAAPADPVVAWVLTDVEPGRWDASLSGAAAGLALSLAGGHGGLTGPEVREAAWRAGWPYPILRAQVWPVRVGEPPPADIAGWIASQPPAVDLGLVRARGTLTDAWVALVSHPRLDLGVLPRQLPLGGALTLPVIPGARVTVADPAGALVEAELALPFTLTTNHAGEWLVEIRATEGAEAIAVFPVYVGLVPPELALLVPGEPPVDDAEAARRVDQLLAEVRDAYGLEPYQQDPLLDAAVKATAADGAIGVERMSPWVGVAPADLWRWECHSTTLEGCLDAIVWDVRARPGLLAAQALVGRVAHVGPDGVGVVLVVARQ
jgi:hypothetical protein